MIGTGALVDPSLGLLLAIGQVPADVPEGFAAIATMRRAGIPRRTRLLMAAGFAIPVLGGAALATSSCATHPPWRRCRCWP